MNGIAIGGRVLQVQLKRERGPMPNLLGPMPPALGAFAGPGQVAHMMAALGPSYLAAGPHPGASAPVSPSLPFMYPSHTSPFSQVQQQPSPAVAATMPGSYPGFGGQASAVLAVAGQTPLLRE